jgi:hypothetical protein
MTKKKCPACSGTGLLAPAVPSCSIPALKHPWIVVEKCDFCDKFTDDMTAGLSRFRIVGWFLCADGGHHALANPDSRVKSRRDRAAYA